MLKGTDAPAIVPEELDVLVEFEKPTPMLSRSEEITNIKNELDMGTINKYRAIKMLHPEFEEEDVQEILNDTASISEMVNNGLDKKGNSPTV
jgi:hypothetical protein